MGQASFPVLRPMMSLTRGPAGRPRELAEDRPHMHASTGRRGRGGLAWAWVLSMALAAGCHEVPIHGTIHADANLAGALQAKVEVRLPTASDPGPVGPVVVRAAPSGASAPRVALVDVDGLLLNQ